MPRVFAPQLPSRFDTATRLWVPSVNIEPAGKFGEVIVMLPPQANRLHTAPLITAMKERMADYSAEDYLVAVGDPSLIAAASIIAWKRAGVLKMLKWDRLTSDYIAVEVNP